MSNLNPSAENYLECILMLEKENGFVRSIDVANKLGFSRASVSRAVSTLRDDGYLTMEDDGQLRLTSKGNEIAKGIYEKHELIAKYLISIGVHPQTALKDACKIEHIISEETFLRMKDHAQKEHDIPK